VAQINLIAVENQDLVLGVGFFNLHRQDGLLDLPPECLVRLEEEHLGELLRERAPPFLFLEMNHILEEGPKGTHRIHAEMVIETGVLGRDDRLDESGRNLGEIDQDSFVPAELVRTVAVGRVKNGDDRRSPVLEAGDFRDVEGEEVSSQGSRPDGKNQEGQEDKPAAQPGRSAGWLLSNSFAIISYI